MGRKNSEQETCAHCWETFLAIMTLHNLDTGIYYTICIRKKNNSRYPKYRNPRFIKFIISIINFLWSKYEYGSKRRKFTYIFIHSKNYEVVINKKNDLII